MVITQQELKTLKSVLGTEYDNVRTFFYNVCVSDFDYKILITRRSYVLFKVFKSIFNQYPEECVCPEDFCLNGIFCNSHSVNHLQLVNSHLSESSFLIVDDIIINGRTIKQIYDILTGFSIPDKNITTWSIACNSEARCIESDVENSFGHVIYVCEEEWKMLSNALTNFVIESNVGYVSFVNTYKIDNINLDEICDLSNGSVLPNQNPNFDNSAITAKIIFAEFCDDEIVKKYNFTSCIRLYEKCNKLIAIPYVFLPALKKENVYEYCISILKRFNLQVPSFLYENGNKCDITLYQWTVRALSDLYMKEFIDSLNDVSINYDTYFNCEESYLFSEEECTGIENTEFSSYLYAGALDSENERTCSLTMEKSIDSQKSIVYNLKTYLKEMRTQDEQRAHRSMERFHGIRLSCVENIFKNKKIDFSHNELLATIIGLWDCGKASFVITDDCDEDTAVIDGFLRHGEQIYLVYYELYSKVYNVFYEYFSRTFETRRKQLTDFAQYFDRNYNTTLFTEFVDGLNIEQYVTDLMAISPDMLVVNPMVQNVKQEVRQYMLLNGIQQ